MKPWNVKTQVTISTKSVCCVSLWYRVNTCFSKTNKTFTTQHFIMACLSFCPAVIWIENSFLCNTSRGCGLLWVPPPNPVSTAPYSRPCNPQKFFLCLPPQLIYGLDSIFCMDSLIASQFSSKLNQFSHSSRPRLDLIKLHWSWSLDRQFTWYEKSILTIWWTSQLPKVNLCVHAIRVKEKRSKLTKCKENWFFCKLLTITLRSIAHIMDRMHYQKPKYSDSNLEKRIVTLC